MTITTCYSQFRFYLLTHHFRCVPLFKQSRIRFTATVVLLVFVIHY